MTSPAVNNPSFSRWVYLFSILNMALHLVFYNTLGFHRDELLYFSLGQHLAAGYASVPPFIGFIAWLMIHTMGYSLFAARIIPMMLSGILVLLGAAIAKEMKGNSYAQVLAAIAIIVTPFNLRAFSMLQPVCFDVFFWSLIFWLALKWINTRADEYLLFLGLSAGMGLLNKYLIALEIVCLLMAFTLTPCRTVFTRKAFYLAIIIALVVFLPNIIWQITYHLPVLTHMRALNDSQLVHVNRVAFFTDQIFINSMALLLIIPGIIALCIDKNFKPCRPLVYASLAVLIFLAVLRGKSYYTGGLYPMLIAAGGVYWELNKAAVYQDPFTCDNGVGLPACGSYGYSFTETGKTCRVFCRCKEGCWHRHGPALGNRPHPQSPPGLCRYAGMGRIGRNHGQSL